MPAPREAVEGASRRPKVTPEIAAEAAVWIARLHGPSRSRQMERDCLAWQQRSAAHREAFERCTDTWAAVPGATVAAGIEAPEPAPVASAVEIWPSRRLALGGVAVLAIAAVVGVFQLGWHAQDRLSTAVGGQQVAVLADGTRVTLNTDTRLQAELQASRRTVTMQRGEALFEVAADASRPFVVRAAGSEVVAIGTTFTVRVHHDGAGEVDRLAVTLLEGRVDLRAVPSGSGLSPRQNLVLRPGERVQLARASSASDSALQVRVDQPNLEQLVAWRRSEAIFDRASLPDAVAEMNRYSRTRITLVDGGGLSRLTISGVYRTGDTAGFARAVAALHGLRLVERDGRLELSKPQ